MTLRRWINYLDFTLLWFERPLHCGTFISIKPHCNEAFLLCCHIFYFFTCICLLHSSTKPWSLKTFELSLRSWSGASSRNMVSNLEVQKWEGHPRQVLPEELQLLESCVHFLDYYYVSEHWKSFLPWIQLPVLSFWRPNEDLWMGKI